MQQKLEKNCFPIAFDLDKEFLFEKALQKPRKVFYFEGKARDNYYYAPFEPEWLKDYIQKSFGLKGRWNMKFVYIPSGVVLDWHVDKGTKCAINWLINNSSASIEFKNGKYQYESAIIDTSKEHRVVDLAGERILFKVSCWDMTYNELCQNFIKRYMKKK